MITRLLATDRAATPVVGVVLMLSVVVLLAAIVSVVVFDVGSQVQSPSPDVVVSDSLVEAGSEQSIAVTMETADGVRTDQIYVTASKDVDVGGAPGSSTPANENYASGSEAFTESSGGNPPQVSLGETWDAGETAYLDPVGGADGVTVRFYWNTAPVEGVNPGRVEGENSYLIAEFTVKGS
jgi:FlaG/FlaF family flagellin (archaellin)